MSTTSCGSLPYASSSQRNSEDINSHHPWNYWMKTKQKNAYQIIVYRVVQSRKHVSRWILAYGNWRLTDLMLQCIMVSLYNPPSILSVTMLKIWSRGNGNEIKNEFKLSFRRNIIYIHFLLILKLSREEMFPRYYINIYVMLCYQ